MISIIDSEFYHSTSNFGGSSWKLFLSCGHVEWRKGSQKLPIKVKCRDCTLGRTEKDSDWIAKFSSMNKS